MGGCSSKSTTLSSPLLTSSTIVECKSMNVVDGVTVSKGNTYDPKTPEDEGADEYMWTTIGLSNPAAPGMQIAGWHITSKCERIVGYSNDGCYFMRRARDENSAKR